MITFFIFLAGVIVGAMLHNWLYAEEAKALAEVQAELGKVKPSIDKLKGFVSKL